MVTNFFTENNKIEYALYELFNNIDFPLENLYIHFSGVRNKPYMRYEAIFDVDFAFMWDDGIVEENYKLIIPFSDEDIYNSLMGKDEDGDYDRRISETAKEEFIENHLNQILSEVKVLIEEYWKHESF